MRKLWERCKQNYNFPVQKKAFFKTLKYVLIDETQFIAIENIPVHAFAKI